MSRRSVFLGVAIVVLLGAGVGTALAFMIRHEPSFYLESELPPGEERQKHSTAFYAEFSRLIEGVLNERQWHATFTAEQINSYFDEDFLRGGSEGQILPEGMSEPRIAIEPDKIRLAFRYGVDNWSTIISIDLRLWIAPKEPNVVALELQALHAGILPISAQSLLERVSDAARQQNIEVTWYRHEGNPVALLRFQPYKANPTFQLQRLELRPGMIVIGGRSLDAAPATALSTAAPAPVAE